MSGILIAVAILAVWILGAFQMGTSFRSKKIRRRIIFGTVGIYLLAAVVFCCIIFLEIT